MHRREIEGRLLAWAMGLESPFHDPSRPSESLEYRMMVLGQVGRGGGHSDGGMMLACHRYRQEIQDKQDARETHQAIVRLRCRDREAYQVLTTAYLDRPGYIMPGRAGASALQISENSWRLRYQRGLSFVDGWTALTT